MTDTEMQTPLLDILGWYAIGPSSPEWDLGKSTKIQIMFIRPDGKRCFDVPSVDDLSEWLLAQGVNMNYIHVFPTGRVEVRAWDSLDRMPISFKTNPSILAAAEAVVRDVHARRQYAADMQAGKIRHQITKAKI